MPTTWRSSAVHVPNLSGTRRWSRAVPRRPRRALMTCTSRRSISPVEGWLGSRVSPTAPGSPAATKRSPFASPTRSSTRWNGAGRRSPGRASARSRSSGCDRSHVPPSARARRRGRALVIGGQSRRPQCRSARTATIAEGGGLGVQVLASGIPAFGVHRPGSSIDHRIVLTAADLGEYVGMGCPRSLLGELGGARRVIDLRSKAPVQLCSLGGGLVNDADVLDALVQRLSEQWPAEGLARPPKVIREVLWPTPIEAVIGALGPPPARARQPVPVALDERSGDMAWIDPVDVGGAMFVAGGRRKGKSSALLAIAAMARRRGWNVVATAGFDKSPLVRPRLSGGRGGAARPGGRDRGPRSRGPDPGAGRRRGSRRRRIAGRRPRRGRALRRQRCAVVVRRSPAGPHRARGAGGQGRAGARARGLRRCRPAGLARRSSPPAHPRPAVGPARASSPMATATSWT